MNADTKTFSGNYGKRPIARAALVSPRDELLDRLRAAFKLHKEFAFVGVNGDVAALDTDFGEGSSADILILDIQHDLKAAIAGIEQLRESGYSGSIITLSQTLDEPSVRGLLRLNVTDWLPDDAGSEDVVEACRRAVAARKQQERAGQATCLAFVPAAGGVGTTTLAIQAAFLIAEASDNYSDTCLIDLNFQTGALADYLDLQPLLDVASLAKTPDRLDRRLLEVMLARHSSGLAVLAPPRAPTDTPWIRTEFITSLLSVVSDNFAHMVLDLPPTWQPWSDDVLVACDEICVVTEFTVPALRKAQELAQAMRERFEDETRVRILVNKFRQQLFGGGLRKTDAIQLLGDDLAGFVPEDHELVNEAINRGEPLTATSRSNKISRALMRLVIDERMSANSRQKILRK